MPKSEPQRDLDERVKLPDDAEGTLRALLAVDPDSEPAEATPDKKNPAHKEPGE